jgi:hypothetical protein
VRAHVSNVGGHRLFLLRELCKFYIVWQTIIGLLGQDGVIVWSSPQAYIIDLIACARSFDSFFSFFFKIGFLYVSRENKGDYALQDIYTALHWLKNYVTHFNGDPDRITLYGSGTGAVLASLVVMLETVNGSCSHWFFLIKNKRLLFGRKKLTSFFL